ncbi:hypothetical protein [Fredinandcohnia onubensis]|uniref:hypothetical protein n=1 Tax=Fredinandcohnia onubensis TaxID=1571209 RepID=UPI000C0C084A|nr:hypothetical protein [Fredinandcohnia onubensis]
MPILETLKGVGKLVKDIGDIELNSKIIDLQNEVFSLVEENHQLRKRVDELETIESLENSLKVKGHFYYKENGDKEDGPFCTSCWDNNSKLIRCHISDPYDITISTCPVCNFGSSYLD